MPTLSPTESILSRTNQFLQQLELAGNADAGAWLYLASAVIELIWGLTPLARSRRYSDLDYLYSRLRFAILTQAHLSQA